MVNKRYTEIVGVRRLTGTMSSQSAPVASSPLDEACCENVLAAEAPTNAFAAARTTRSETPR